MSHFLKILAVVDDAKQPTTRRMDVEISGKFSRSKTAGVDDCIDVISLQQLVLMFSEITLYGFSEELSTLVLHEVH